jgi:small subunit ribosomal protein S8
MSLNDTLSNVLSQIVSYEKAGKKEFVTKSNSKLIRQVLAIMQENHYIGSFEELIDAKGNMLKINLIGAINKTGVIKPRFSVARETYEKFEKRYLPAKDFGFLIISTSKGMFTHTVAKEKKLGGKLICYCY